MIYACVEGPKGEDFEENISKTFWWYRTKLKKNPIKLSEVVIKVLHL